MLLSTAALWLKLENSLPVPSLPSFSLSPCQWPLFSVQMRRCADNIPVGFGGGWSLCRRHSDPTVLRSPLEPPSQALMAH